MPGRSSAKLAKSSRRLVSEGILAEQARIRFDQEQFPSLPAWL